MKNENIRMIRSSLDGLPEFDMPDDVRVRWYEEGDEETWLRINGECDQFNNITPKLFRSEYDADENGNVDHAELQKRMFFLVDREGNDFGTTSAWYHDDPVGVPRGLIHWVGILPPYQGRGLAKPMMTVAFRRMKELGHDSVFLTTSSARIPAVRLYLKFGFLPFVYDKANEAIWKRHQDALGVGDMQWHYADGWEDR